MTTRSKLIRPLEVLLVVGCLAGAVSCDALLTVENPGQVPEDALQGNEAINTLVNGLYGDLQDAYDLMVLFSGLFSDELAHSGSFPTFNQIDRRAIVNNNVNLLDIYTDLMTARFTGDQAVARVREALGPDAANSALLAEALMLTGWVHLLIADNFCEATIDAGAALPSSEFYSRAEALFTEAITVAEAAGTASGLSASAANIRLAALVGRARARLALGQLGEAAADADQVPAAFAFNILYAETSGRENNEVTVFTVLRRETSIGEPFWNDPRIPQCSSHPASTVPACAFATEGPLGPDNTTPLFVQLLYTVRASPIPLATGVDAGFIAREARGEDVAEEKAFATFLRGQRLADLRRRDDPFLAGGDQCFPIPEREIDTNPNL
jgi:hypothetical protein